MKRATRTSTKRWTIGGVGVAGAFILWLTTNGNNVTSMLNNLSNLRKKPAAATVVNASSTPAIIAPMPQGPQPQKAASEHHAPNAVRQVSTGVQSPNLSDVHGFVHLEYGSSNGPKTSSELSPALTDTVSVVRSDEYPVQVSTGGQSPNISGVGKDVEIKYERNTPNH